MDLLIKKAIIVDPGTSLNGKQMDILVSDGKIGQIGKDITSPKAKKISIKGLHVSPGWLDVGVQTGDPGKEHREDLTTVTKAAAAGGFTGIACFPNTDPVADSKSGILYLKQNSRHLAVDCFPIGALSEGCNGKDITELYDMHEAGACAFSDGEQSIQHAGLMLRGLLYVKAFDGLVINHPHDKTLAANGQMHEGYVSTSLGLRGISGLTEAIMVQRDIELAEYAHSKVHIYNISTARSVEKIKKAKAKGIQVTTSVAALNLLYDDAALTGFDANFKVLPPLRSKEDIKALKKGLKDGTIDFITSNHVPLEEEAKKLEFPYASFGALGLETAFGVAHTALKKNLSIENLIDKLSVQPRRILGLPEVKLEKDAHANLTLFIPGASWTVSQDDFYSRSENTPLIGHELQGKVIGIINGGNTVLNKM
jgi:dihydroorotase